jgi:two-component system chemotaxis response regulator CheY
MEKLYIVCIEDQREVLNSIVEDLSFFEAAFIIEECESASEAEDIIEDIDAKGDYLAVIISDHVMPGKNGVDFLTDLHDDVRFKSSKKILLTGLATHADTIRAINRAAIDRYIEKPWQTEVLIQYVKELITFFVLQKGIPYEPLLPYLDKNTLFELLKQAG